MSAPGQSSPARPVFAALLAGGKGTRFWPASRAANPKQFLKLLGDRSLLRSTFDRFRRLVPADRILVVTSPAYVARTLEELPELAPSNLIIEPSGHDTAPAAALAAQAALASDDDPVLVVAPTDHFIADEGAFARALAAGIEAADAGSLVTFGVVPDRPATVYGYIEVETAAAPGALALPVVRFREKPKLDEARAFLATGRFFWNAGIFAWRARVFERSLRDVAPDLAAALARLPALPERNAAGGAGREDAFAHPPGFVEAWEALPSISVDYALMERAKNVHVVPLAAGWSDVGGWDAVRDLLPADPDGNCPDDAVVYVGATHCSVHRHGNPDHVRSYALVETEGLIVVDTPDAVLICRRGAGESLREVVKRLRAAGREDLL